MRECESVGRSVESLVAWLKPIIFSSDPEWQVRGIPGKIWGIIISLTIKLNVRRRRKAVYQRTQRYDPIRRINKCISYKVYRFVPCFTGPFSVSIFID